jgi:hypothetical protein
MLPCSPRPCPCGHQRAFHPRDRTVLRIAQAVREHAQPDRIDIVRAKRHLLGQLGDGQPHPTSTLMASVAALLGAEPLAYPRVELPSRDSVTTLITADHPVPAPISPHARHWRNWPPRGC